MKWDLALRTLRAARNAGELPRFGAGSKDSASRRACCRQSAILYVLRKDRSSAAYENRKMRKYSQNVSGLRLRSAPERAGIPQDRPGVMIGIGDGSSSARSSRYQAGVHQPTTEIVEQIAGVPNAPASYFYCRSDPLGELLLAVFDFSGDEFNRMKKSVERIRRSRR